MTLPFLLTAIMASTLPFALFLFGTLTTFLYAYQPYPKAYSSNFQRYQKIPTLTERFLKRNDYREPLKRVADPKDSLADPHKRSTVTILCNPEQCRQLMEFLNRTIPGGYEAIPNLWKRCQWLWNCFLTYCFSWLVQLCCAYVRFCLFNFNVRYWSHFVFKKKTTN